MHDAGSGSSLERWLGRGLRPQRDGQRGGAEDGLLFAFLGRASTRDHQDPATTRGWQREVGERLIEGHGVIVAEFFDVACSRQVPWAERPQAGALLAALADPDRGFDAVVVGEYERAFDAGHFDDLLPA